MKILRLAIKDFFTLQFLKFALIPLTFSFILMIFLAIFGFSFLLDYFNSLFSVGEDSFWAWFYALHFVQILITLISVLFSGFVIIFASVFLALFITSFLTPLIVKQINNKYYHHEVQNISNMYIIFEIFQNILKFIGIFFYFAPWLCFCLLSIFLCIILLFIIFFTSF
ncbi:EI24 domain-containing protein [Campylobacter coli]